MKLTTRMALAGITAATALTGLAATPAAAQSSVSIEYRDRGYGYGYGYDDRDWRDYRDHDRRDWRDDRRYWDNRRDWRDRRYYEHHRDDYRCWTEWRMAGRYDRYQVRVCR